MRPNAPTFLNLGGSAPSSSGHAAGVPSGQDGFAKVRGRFLPGKETGPLFGGKRGPEDKKTGRASARPVRFWGMAYFLSTEAM